MQPFRVEKCGTTQSIQHIRRVFRHVQQCTNSKPSALSIPVALPLEELGLQASDDVGPTSAVIDSYMEDKERAAADADRIVRAAAAVATEHGVPRENVVQAAIEPVSDVTSDISAAITHYVSAHQVRHS